MNFGLFGRIAAPMMLALLLAACGTTSNSTGTSPSPRDAVANPHQKIGTPYYVSGIRYVPREQPNYVATGTASWYGPKFHGRLTANGEVFDMERLTAAHKTLPLPSLVKVTNLENNRSVVVRLNDRGPFSGDRVIDLSKKTAETLGMKEKGLAEVRVEYVGPADMKYAITHTGQRENYAALEPPRRYRNQIPDVVLAHTEPNTEEETADILTASLNTMPEEPEVVEKDLEPIAIVMSDDTIPSASNVPVPAETKPPRDLSPTGASYFVQVGVFSNPENAAAASSRFAEYLPMTLEAVAVGNDLRQRLRIGPYAHEFAAEAALREAVEHGFADAHIVRGAVLY